MRKKTLKGLRNGKMKLVTRFKKLPKLFYIKEQRLFMTAYNTKYLAPKFFSIYISRSEKFSRPKFAFVSLQQTSDIWIRYAKCRALRLLHFAYRAADTSAAMLRAARRDTSHISGYPKFLSANPSGFASRNFGLSAHVVSK